MIDHDRIEELIAVDALDGLDPEDAETLAEARAAHGPGCEECARLDREYRGVAGALATALDPVPMRAGFEADVVSRAVRRGRRPSGEPVRREPWRRLGIAAAAAALLVGGWVLRGLAEGPGGPSGRFLAEATLLPFEGGPGRLAVAYVPDGGDAFLFGSDLPATSEGEVYELWVFDGDRPIPAGCFSPEDGEVITPVDQNVGVADLLAVTVEADACPRAPTTDPIFTAKPMVT
jgi:Anti-sigma-K factor rskA